MNIVLNNRAEKIDTTRERITVNELFDLKNFSYKMIMVRVNGQNVSYEEYDSTYVANGDHVDVIHLISGG